MISQTVVYKECLKKISYRFFGCFLLIIRAHENRVHCLKCELFRQIINRVIGQEGKFTP